MKKLIVMMFFVMVLRIHDNFAQSDQCTVDYQRQTLYIPNITVDPAKVSPDSLRKLSIDLRTPSGFKTGTLILDYLFFKPGPSLLVWILQNKQSIVKISPECLINNQKTQLISGQYGPQITLNNVNNANIGIVNFLDSKFDFKSPIKFPYDYKIIDKNQYGEILVDNMGNKYYWIDLFIGTIKAGIIKVTISK